MKIWRNEIAELSIESFDHLYSFRYWLKSNLFVEIYCASGFHITGNYKIVILMVIYVHWHCIKWAYFFLHIDRDMFYTIFVFGIGDFIRWCRKAAETREISDHAQSCTFVIYKNVKVYFCHINLCYAYVPFL